MKKINRSLIAIILMVLFSQMTLARDCEVVNVAAFQSRIHILCKPLLPPPNCQGWCVPTTVNYFASATTPENKEFNNQILTLATAAVQTGKKLNIDFDANLDASSFGCLYNDCRKLTAISLGAK